MSQKQFSTGDIVTVDGVECEVVTHNAGSHVVQVVATGQGQGQARTFVNVDEVTKPSRRRSAKPEAPADEDES